MKNHIDIEVSKLKSMESSEAADWIIERYPVDSENYGDGISLLIHKSWKKEDQRKLADHFFRKIPFANARPYEVFASFMAIHSFLRSIEKNMPDDSRDLELLRYHLKPVLIKWAKTDSSKELVENFLAKLS